MRRMLLGLVLCAVFARPASASPITYEWSGLWQHVDGPNSQPDFFAAMLSVGVTNGTPITFDQTFNDDGSIFNLFTLGNVEYSYLDTYSHFPIGAQGFYSVGLPVVGPTVQGPLLTYHVSDIEFATQGATFPAPNPPGPLQVGDSGTLRFGYAEPNITIPTPQHEGISFMTLTAIVPEANTIWFTVLGLTLALPIVFRRRAVPTRVEP